MEVVRTEEELKIFFRNDTAQKSSALEEEMNMVFTNNPVRKTITLQEGVTADMDGHDRILSLTFQNWIIELEEDYGVNTKYDSQVDVLMIYFIDPNNYHKYGYPMNSKTPHGRYEFSLVFDVSKEGKIVSVEMIFASSLINKQF